MPTSLLQLSALVAGEQSDVLTGNLVGDLSRSVKIIERQFSRFQAERLADLERQQRPITVDQVKDLLEHYHQLSTREIARQTQNVLKRFEKIEATVAHMEKELDKISSTLIQPNLAAASFDAASHVRPRLRSRGWSYSMARRHVDSQRWSKASSGVWSEYEDIDFLTDPNMRSRAGSLAQPGNQQVIYETQRDTT